MRFSHLQLEAFSSPDAASKRFSGVMYPAVTLHPTTILLRHISTHSGSGIDRTELLDQSLTAKRLFFFFFQTVAAKHIIDIARAH